MSSCPETALPELPAHWSRLCVSRLHYQVTWFTRGRRPVLTADRAEILAAVLHELSLPLGARLEAIAVGSDRVRLLLSLPPSESVGSVVRELKGRSALALLDRRPDLRLHLGGHLVWNENYGISTVSPQGLARRKARLAAGGGPEADPPLGRC
jgi:REP element-mobilizing transposase RayT